ncbi:MAG: MotA/TolQ/ExbB proton channel family protein [Bacteroidales bacterium]|jgi:biopolymer transport protein ExbB|nr:MotA/TolQ/ExbB proton channel family protein [Bacteroidales bacterium]
MFLLDANVIVDSINNVAQNAEQTEKTLNLLDLAVKGGPIMIVLGVLSIFAVYIFIDKVFALRKASRDQKLFMNKIKNSIVDGNMKSALDECRITTGPLARMIEKGVMRIGRPLNDVNVAVENVGKQEIAKLEKSLPVLASIAGGSPMLGFLGTVTGMVRAFFDMANAGNNLDIQLLSNGIYEALVTTVGGLIVGIMAYFAYNYLVSRINNLVAMLEVKTTEFMDILNEPVK